MVLWILIGHVLELISVAERVEQAYEYFYPTGNNKTESEAAEDKIKVKETTNTFLAGTPPLTTTSNERRYTQRYDFR